MDGNYPFDLGPHVWPVSTRSPGAQLWFDRGLNWLYGFNHEEAVLCFERATQFDPGLGMAWWGIAYASGPFYNMPWWTFTLEEKQEATAVSYMATQKALGCVKQCGEVEAALITALSFRYPEDHLVEPFEFENWEWDYADAMRSVYDRFPDNLNVTALCVEALINLTPWKLWDVHTGKVARGTATLEALDLLEKAMPDDGSRLHQAILHLYIHVLEMSGEPERALRAADLMSGLSPDAGHIEHMPGHIYVLCGQYPKAIACSHKAIAADRKYLAFRGPLNFYTTSRCHDLHLLMYSAMMSGCLTPAVKAAEEIKLSLTPEVLSTKKNHMAITVEGYFATHMHVLVRFGRWQDILDQPLPPSPALYVVTTAMHFYARCVALANLKRLDEARVARQDFQAALAAVPQDRLYFNNQAHDILAVATAMMSGELAYHSEDYTSAFDHLRHAVYLDDHLFYTEPWAWMHPPRHALGALLLEQGHVDEAEAVYRADLGLDPVIPRCCQHPGNIWALHGLAECQRRLGKDNADTQAQFERAQEQADTVISSSCCCRGS